ncbi:MAG: hypothetical protein Q9170_002410 [Blastenia crenularia]
MPITRLSKQVGSDNLQNIRDDLAAWMTTTTDTKKPPIATEEASLAEPAAQEPPVDSKKCPPPMKLFRTRTERAFGPKSAPSASMPVPPATTVRRLPRMKVFKRETSRYQDHTRRLLFTEEDRVQKVCSEYVIEGSSKRAFSDGMQGKKEMSKAQVQRLENIARMALRAGKSLDREGGKLRASEAMDGDTVGKESEGGGVEKVE